MMTRHDELSASLRIEGRHPGRNTKARKGITLQTRPGALSFAGLWINHITVLQISLVVMAIKTERQHNGLHPVLT